VTPDAARAAVTHFLGRWSACFSLRDVDGLVGLYVDQPLFFGSAPDLRVDLDGIRAYFEAIEPQEETRVDFEVLCATTPAPGVVEGASRGTFRWKGNPGIPIRFTHTLVQREGHWVAAAHHASPG
jgi:hypothetical protein